MEDLENYLVVNGYNRASTVRAPGEFAVRGGLIDVFPPGAIEPLRFDFFGDELEAIRSFDPETQISKAKLKTALLTPVSEVLLDDHDRAAIPQAASRRAFGAVSDPLYDSVSARIRRQGVEQFLPFFYERLETVFDYARRDALVAFDALGGRSAQGARRNRARSLRFPQNRADPTRRRSHSAHPSPNCSI
jgi:transcription-repair coupling factor (superfamily II helicase)